MVRVVGDAPEVVKRTTCVRCDAVLEYKNVDVGHRTYINYNLSEVVFRCVIVCPRCFSDVEVKDPRRG